MDVVGLQDLNTLIEISIVVNLAFRELKFTKLHDETDGVVTRVRGILGLGKDYNSRILKLPKDWTENEKLYWNQLLYLVNPNKGDPSLWNSFSYRRTFYNNFILSRLGLNIANIGIIVNILLLVVFVKFSSLRFDFDSYSLQIIICELIIFSALLLIFCKLKIDKKIRKLESIFLFPLCVFSWLVIPYLWGLYGLPFLFNLSFVTVIVLTFLPLLFIKMTTLCEDFLLDEDGESGRITCLENQLKLAEDRRAEIREKARGFAVTAGNTSI